MRCAPWQCLVVMLSPNKRERHVVLSSDETDREAEMTGYMEIKKNPTVIFDVRRFLG